MIFIYALIGVPSRMCVACLEDINGDRIGDMTADECLISLKLIGEDPSPVATIMGPRDHHKIDNHSISEPAIV